MCNKDILLKFIIPVLLCIVAFAQIYNVYKNNLTLWKGGGFGMFASIDRVEYRPVIIDIYKSGKKYKADFRNLVSSSRERNFIYTMPTSVRVKKLHTEASSHCYKLIDEHTKVVQVILDECDFQYLEELFLKDQKNAPFKPDSVVIKVNRLKFDTNSGMITHEEIIRKN